MYARKRNCRIDTIATVLANSYESVKTKLRTAIVGVGGCAGGKLARLLLNHPRPSVALRRICCRFNMWRIPAIVILDLNA